MNWELNIEQAWHEPQGLRQMPLSDWARPPLASALVEHAATDSVLRKKLGILLAGTEGAEKLSNEIENRIRTIGRSRSYVDWDKRKGLVQEHVLRVPGNRSAK
jgi:hypothetical protein